MIVFDLTNILTLVLALASTVLCIYLSQEIKKSFVIAIPLFIFVFDLIVHTVQMLTLTPEFAYLYSTICYNMAIDFVFILVTFLAYLWADEIEAKAFNKKSIDNSLKWLWKKV